MQLHVTNLTGVFTLTIPLNTVPRTLNAVFSLTEISMKPKELPTPVKTFDIGDRQIAVDRERLAQVDALAAPSSRTNPNVMW